MVFVLFFPFLIYYNFHIDISWLAAAFSFVREATAHAGWSFFFCACVFVDLISTVIAANFFLSRCIACGYTADTRCNCRVAVAVGVLIERKSDESFPEMFIYK